MSLFEWCESGSPTALPLTHTHGEPGGLGLTHGPGIRAWASTTKHGAMLRVSGEQDRWRGQGPHPRLG